MTDASGPSSVLSGRYELRDLLGRGGMAEVHRAFDRVLHREVAVKLMHTTLIGDVDRRRLASEARVLAGLNDAHLVMVLDAGVEETGGFSRPWLVMELVEGSTLADRISAGPLSSSDVVALGLDVAAALTHVHAAGIVHRDVKPANVLLTRTGAAKLADFGVARIIGEHSELTGTGHTIGTAAYLAPEQIQGHDVTGASDVYALGLVLLESLTARRAYTGSPTEAALARLHRGPAIPVSLGGAWVRLLDEMTSGDPAARPDAAQVARRLVGLRDAAPATPFSAATAPATATERLPLAPASGTLTNQGNADATALLDPPLDAPLDDEAPDRRRGLAIVVAALAAAVVLGGCALWLAGGGPDSDASGASGSPDGSSRGATHRSSSTPRASAPTSTGAPSPSPSPLTSAAPSPTVTATQASPPQAVRRHGGSTAHHRHRSKGHHGRSHSPGPPGPKPGKHKPGKPHKPHKP